MSNPDNSSDTDEPTHGQQDDDSRIDSFIMNDQTVLFDVDDAECWIQSDTAVDLADVA